MGVCVCSWVDMHGTEEGIQRCCIAVRSHGLASHAVPHLPVEQPSWQAGARQPRQLLARPCQDPPASPTN